MSEKYKTYIAELSSYESSHCTCGLEIKLSGCVNESGAWSELLLILQRVEDMGLEVANGCHTLESLKDYFIISEV